MCATAVPAVVWAESTLRGKHIRLVKCSRLRTAHRAVAHESQPLMLQANESLLTQKETAAHFWTAVVLLYSGF